MNIVVPMAGVSIPKPLIAAAGRPMIAWALDSLAGLTCSRIIFVVLAGHEARYGVCNLLRSLVTWPAPALLLDDVTEGASRELVGTAASSELARRFVSRTTRVPASTTSAVAASSWRPTTRSSGTARKPGGEYYVVPVYPKYVQFGWRVGLSVARAMRDMGAPEALVGFARQGAVESPRRECNAATGPAAAGAGLE